MENRKILNKITLENFSKLKYLSLIFIGYSVFILILDFGPIKVWDDRFIETYRVLDILLAFLSLFSVLFFWFYRKENYFAKDLGIKLTIFLVLIWSAIITGIELTSLGFSALIVVLLISVFFVYNNLLTSVVYFLGAFLTLIGTVFFRNEWDKSLVPTFSVLIPIIAISVFISRKNYQSKINELINTNKLKDLNYELKTIKENLETIVEQRTLELYIAKEKAEESDRLKSAFLANMSHEIRTPMNGILGFAGLLKEPNLTGEDQINYISMIEEGGERMLNIINNLIDISKIESGTTKISISEANINSQLEYIYSFFKPEVEKKGMQLFVKTTLQDKEAIIKTDREKIYAILTNLIKNAIKYSESGFIELGCGSTSSPTGSVGEHAELQFYVKDTGIGIAKDRQNAIFERFIQADIEDARAFQGAGLGLSISKAYVEMLGGKMWVESEIGKGSVFYFTLPCITDQPKLIANKNTQSNNQPENEIKKLNILLAEDNKASEVYLTAIIQSIAKKILKTRTGTETLEVCRQTPDIELILMDIRMPGMDGYETTRQIRQFNKKVIIIAQTAFALAGDREKALEAGCNDYIMKPIKAKVLKEMLIRHLNVSK